MTGLDRLAVFAVSLCVKSNRGSVRRFIAQIVKNDNEC
jgi:hypothetical protein